MINPSVLALMVIPVYKIFPEPSRHGSCHPYRHRWPPRSIITRLVAMESSKILTLPPLLRALPKTKLWPSLVEGTALCQAKLHTRWEPKFLRNLGARWKERSAFSKYNRAKHGIRGSFFHIKCSTEFAQDKNWVSGRGGKASLEMSCLQALLFLDQAPLQALQHFKRTCQMWSCREGGKAILFLFNSQDWILQHSKLSFCTADRRWTLEISHPTVCLCF